MIRLWESNNGWGTVQQLTVEQLQWSSARTLICDKTFFWFTLRLRSIHCVLTHPQSASLPWCSEKISPCLADGWKVHLQWIPRHVRILNQKEGGHSDKDGNKPVNNHNSTWHFHKKQHWCHGEEQPTSPLQASTSRQIMECLTTPPNLLR